MKRAALAAIASLAAVPAASEFRLDLPIDCDLGQNCFIQQFVDHDPGPDAHDFTCGTLSYDGHKGTDFALPTLSDIASDVDVLAAAPGVVAGLRDGMADRLYAAGDQAVAQKECGNGIVIRHADGWETQYCHMKSGSVAVAQGDVVEAGTVLGQVGLSGQTQFAHLHLSVRHNGQVIDPFHPEMSATCGQAQDDLWVETPDFTPGGFIYAGFSDHVPDYTAVKQHNVAQAELADDAPGLVLFFYAYGGREGDVVTLTINGPDGPFLSQDIATEKDQAQFFRAVGKRRTQGPWQPGEYTGVATLSRNGAEIDRVTTDMIIE